MTERAKSDGEGPRRRDPGEGMGSRSSPDPATRAKAWRIVAGAVVAGAVAATTACATLGLGDVLSAPRFSEVPEREPTMRILGPSAERPRGGAAIRLWTRVENPNPVGLTLASLVGELFLEDARAAGVDFPLGIPLPAGQDTVIPLELSVSFEDLPGLADAATRAITGQPLNYRLDGTVSVDAGALGAPSFGPSTLLRGELDVLR